LPSSITTSASPATPPRFAAEAALDGFYVLRTRNTVRFGRAATFPMLAISTEIQGRAPDLLDLQPTL
jgi:hypothetical protein